MSGLCTPGQASATITKNTTAQQDEAQKRANLMIPADSPDVTDSLMTEARKRMAMNLVQKQSRRDALANNAGAPTPTSYSLLK